MSTRVAILGAGQLSLYLCEAARALGLQAIVMSETDDAPALNRADDVVIGELDDLEALDDLIAISDVVTFDKEDIPDAALAHLVEAQAEGRIVNHPGADLLMMLKDKALQKTWLQQHELPTLPFHILSGDDVRLEDLDGNFAGPVVQKSRRGGYDGRGVQILVTEEDRARAWDTPSIVEPFLPDCREVSVITARAADGELQTYPPVSMDFDAELNSVKTVYMPAGVDSNLAASAVSIAERAIDLLGGVGVFAVEMFVTPDDEVLINEISPRVHNSGHLTLDGCNVSQFEQHIRAVAGLPLLAVEANGAAAMLNILYEPEHEEHCPAKPVAQPAQEASTTIYWYGKAPGRLGRKMGHINSVADTSETAIARAQSALARLSLPNGERAA